MYIIYPHLYPTTVVKCESIENYTNKKEEFLLGCWHKLHGRQGGESTKGAKGGTDSPPHLYNVITLLYFYTIIYVCIQKVFLKKFSLCWLAYWVQKWELKSTTLATTFYYGKNIIFGDRRWDSNLGSASNSKTCYLCHLSVSFLIPKTGTVIFVMPCFKGIST